jgi:three-Cys-motif partner protein
MKVEEPKPSWGGPWTERKLNAFSKYVRAYLKIMNRNPHWQTVYFDGFAGSGDRGGTAKGNELLLKLDIKEEEERVYEGAAERVIRLQKPFEFDFYYFIDKEERHLKQLKVRLLSIPEGVEKKDRLVFRSGDCNTELIKLAEAFSRKHLAVLAFLDPFGMQIGWNAIQKLKGTRTDLWVLVPTGVIVNRLLDRKGELKSIKKLESFFGLSEKEIREHFYPPSSQGVLFEGQYAGRHKAPDPIAKIAALYVERLGQVWNHVTNPPLVPENRIGSPLFHFVFASNNANALKIAQDIIKNV